jgi:hypothetical protein
MYSPPTYNVYRTKSQSLESCNHQKLEMDQSSPSCFYSWCTKRTALERLVFKCIILDSELLIQIFTFLWNHSICCNGSQPTDRFQASLMDDEIDMELTRETPFSSPSTVPSTFSTQNPDVPNRPRPKVTVQNEKVAIAGEG